MSKSFVFIYLFLISAFSFIPLNAQTPTPTSTPPEITIGSPDDEDDVIKIDSSLIQTGITVVDKKGQFIDQLKLDDFELSVDGTTVPVSFFEKVQYQGNTQPAGTPDKKAGKTNGPATVPATSSALSGRTIIFLVDDLHLSFDSEYRTKKMIKKFLDKDMQPDDLVAVISTSNKIGFLQQFTGDKEVLYRAVDRLIYARDMSAADKTPPPMSEYEAQMIDRWDPEVTNVFVQETLKTEPGANADSVREEVRGRARMVLTQAAIVNKGLYYALEQSIRNSASIPGRKVVFFVSDGFLLDPANTDSSYRMQRITDAAARTNTVIYSFNARGLEAGFPEGTTGNQFGSQVGYRVQSNERFESGDGLSHLADSTGGKFIHDTNDLQAGLTGALKEVGTYYLLAWEPISEADKSDKLRKIKVAIKNHPEYKVRLQNGYLTEASKAAFTQNQSKNKKAKAEKNTLTPVEVDLRGALSQPLPARDVPTALVANYVNDPNDGAVLAAAVQVKTDVQEFTQNAEAPLANINLLGVVFDDKGKRAAYFNELLTINASPAELKKSSLKPVFYNCRIKLQPGLYQIRVATRGAKTARVGSAMQWILIPDLTKKKLALSSLVVGEQTNKTKPFKNASGTENGIFEGGISVDRQFSHTSDLRYLIFAYNSDRGKSGDAVPQISVQTRILRNGEMVKTSQMKPIVANADDTGAVPYASEIPLSDLPAGKYELEVTVLDRSNNATAEQRVKFQIK